MWKCFHCSWKHSWKHSLKPGHANKGTFAKICYRTFFSFTSVKKMSFFHCSHTFSACTLPMWKKLSGFFDHSMTSSTFICYGYLTVLRSVISELWYGVKWCLRKCCSFNEHVHFCADTNERSKDRWNERQSDCIYCREKLWRSVKVLLFVKKYITSKTKQQQEKECLLLTNFYPFCLLLVVHQRKKWVSRLLILLR